MVYMVLVGVCSSRIIRRYVGTISNAIPNAVSRLCHWWGGFVPRVRVFANVMSPVLEFGAVPVYVLINVLHLVSLLVLRWFHCGFSKERSTYFYVLVFIIIIFDFL